MLIESNTNISGLPGFGTNFGTKEARFALAMSAAGLGGGGGGGGITQAEAEAAFTAALQSQAATEVSQLLLEDSTGKQFIRRTTIDEETGIITAANFNLDGTATTVTAPFSLPTATNNLSNTRLAKAIATSTDVAIGDILEFKFSSDSTTPNTIAAGGWNNLTQQTNNITAPVAANYIWLDQIASGDIKLRLVNSNVSSVLLKSTNGIIKSIYIDNLAARTLFVQVFQGLAASPTTGAVPLESYRCPANGSISFDFGTSGTAYIGQIHLGFSTTAGTFTAYINNKNLVVNYR